MISSKFQKNEPCGLTIGIPNKGRLREPILSLFERAGLVLEENGRSLTANIKNENIRILFLRAKDMPLFISEGVVDIGITGYDVWNESGLELKDLLDLKFGQCDLVLAGPEKYKDRELKSGVKVGTSFPSLTANYLAKRGVIARIIEVSGAVEILPSLGVADLVVDITSTGTTLRENNLMVLDKIMSSTARVLCKKKKPKCIEFAKRLEEVLK